ncbi:MAG: M1 family aminopeptidase, partial [Thermoprotei archaeon]
NRYGPDKKYLLKHVKMDGELNYKEKTLDASATLDLELIDPSAHNLALDAVNFSIRSVTLNGRPAEHFYDGRRIVVAVPESLRKRGAAIKISVDYSVKDPKLGLKFVSPDENHPEKPYQAWTQGESEGNRYWLPLYDHPSQKCTSEISLTVPAGHSVESNGILLERKEADGKVTFHYKMDQPHSTYLIAFCAGEFDTKTDSFDGIPLIYNVPKGRGSDIDRSFSKTPDMMKFFGEHTGVRYPYKKYAQTCMVDFGGGMENISATTHTERTLHDEIAHLDFSSDGLVSHELAHQWFGDLITCKDWAHIWLNESFATFYQCLYFRHDRGVDEFYYELVENLDTYLEESKKRYIRPISTKLYSQPDEVFDRHSYEKGSLVLNSLMNYLGEEDYRRGITAYLNRYAFQCVETDDLRKELENASGKNLEWFFDQWIYGAGHPELHVSNSYDDSSKSLIIRFEQRQQDLPPFKLPVEIEVSAGGKTWNYKFTVEGRSNQLSIPLQARPDRVCIDPYMSIVGVLDLEEDEKSRLERVSADPHLYCRVLAARALSKQPSTKAIETLTKVLLSDAHWGVCSEAAKALGKIGSKEAFEALRKGVEHGHPKVRRAVAAALGEFTSEDALKILSDIFSKEKSYYVRSAAALSMGKTKQEAAISEVKKALTVSSHNDVIASAAAQALGEIKKEECVPTLIELCSPKTKDPVRRAAVAALGSYTDNQRVRALLEELSKDDDPMIRGAVVAAASASGDIRLLPVVSSIEAREINGRVSRMAQEARRKLSVTPEQTSQLRDRLEAQEKEIRRLKDEIEALKARLTGKT